MLTLTVPVYMLPYISLKNYQRMKNFIDVQQ